MKRPAFQFYPADWRNNAKLRRCSWGARGVWIELMGLMHDSDHYGVLRWSLKEIAQALGAPISLVRELVDKGVLYGAEAGQCEPMIYTPVSGRKQGEPVELIAAQAGPIWYSPRMVRDEYVRTKRGENSRFGASNGDDPNPSPKGGFGASKGVAPKAAPTPHESDGSTSSSSSSSSPSVANATSGEDRRRRFEMHADWEPDEVNLRFPLRTAGLALEAITPALVGEFTGYWLTQPHEFTHADWCRRLVQHAVRNRATLAAGATHDSTATRGGAAGRGITLAENLTDTSWADGIDVL
ncbi:DnaT-like ssDNA-binding domain-containing protein [Pseudomonas sp. UBA6310]|uniref:DnaT-like ssDNA-binding domain-containing protein n=1 Tax=Pseudomonas sp. UBA6310 TaxID=1947327 RepID=UPI00257B42B3|nr:DnaT-like ssDNA-binding domain-containing protein [Pseudomonas sp. UBA6310]